MYPPSSPTFSAETSQCDKNVPIFHQLLFRPTRKEQLKCNGGVPGIIGRRTELHFAT